jgi:ribosomal protein S18 acetylase RimI-like enzyme
MTELERCLALLKEIDHKAAKREVPFRFGTAYLHDELPRVWSRNYLSLERDLKSVTPGLVSAEADRLLGEAGIAHRKVEVFDAEVGERLVPGLTTLGWRVECDVVMVAAGEPDREVDVSVVEEVERTALEPIWAEAQSADSDVGGEEVIRQLAEGKRVLESAVGARFFAARADGELGAYCELYSGSGTGQIENVLTLERFRNRGLARALVLRALAESRAGGNDVTFLLADRDDWPKELYRKLGFEEIGFVYDFVVPTPPS